MACMAIPSTDLGVDRHVGLQLLLRIVDVDLDAVNQLHALLLVWICLGVNSAWEEMKVTRPA